MTGQLRTFLVTRPDGSVVYESLVDDNTVLVVGTVVVRDGRLWLLSTSEGNEGSLVDPDLPIVGDLSSSLSVEGDSADSSG